MATFKQMKAVSDPMAPSTDRNLQILEKRERGRGGRISLTGEILVRQCSDGSSPQFCSAWNHVEDGFA